MGKSTGEVNQIFIPQALPRIFEPFFRIKAPDKSTGLSLSIVAEIVQNYNGFVQIHSRVGKGRELKIYLPALNSIEMHESREMEKALPVGHGDSSKKPCAH